MNADQAIDRLESQIQEIEVIFSLRSFSAEFKKWVRDTEIAIEYIFGVASRHLGDFRSVEYEHRYVGYRTTQESVDNRFKQGLVEAEHILRSMIEEIQNYGLPELSDIDRSDNLSLTLLLSRFHIVARQLRERHQDRQTLVIEDEYDVQDLLHALLKLYYDDVRPEEWTPSYAGASARMDFLLKQQKTVLEVKKTRETLRDKKVGEELLVDIAKYREHSDCEKLYCFIYDPEQLIRNPQGLEKDLSRDEDGLKITVIVTPKGT